MKRVLITGAGRGIGYACAKKFVSEGYTVVAHYNKSQSGAKKLGATLCVKADISDYKQVAEMFDQINKAIGGVDIVVNNAGIAESKLFDTITPEEWHNMIGVNLSGTFFVSQLAAKGMISRKYGRIINMSSIWGMAGASMETHYSAAKAGIIGLTKAMAKELGPSGITVNCVAPGVIKTDMLDNLTQNDLNELKSQTPLGRLGTPEEIAELIYYLASDKASFITGQVISPNGGLL
ncbi:MAG: SDR family oxidoreductase [Firmicutes bacterium]|nr:SDR family oxidoreductase [Bacillota bacterium]